MDSSSHGFRTERRFESIAPFLFFLAAWAIAWSYDPRSVAFTSDNQIAFFVSERVASGVPPHVSLIDIENQLASLLSGASIALGRMLGIDDVVAARCFSITAASLTVAGVWMLTRRLTQSFVFACLASTVMLTFTDVLFQAAMGERPKVLVAACVVWALASHAAGRIFIAGLFSAAAYLTWQPAAFVGVAVALGVAGTPSPARGFARLAAGVATGVALYEAYFWATGALGPQIDQSYLLLFERISYGLRGAVTEQAKRLIEVVPQSALIAIAAALLWLVSGKKYSRRRRGVSIALRLVGVLALAFFLYNVTATLLIGRQVNSDDGGHLFLRTSLNTTRYLLYVGHAWHKFMPTTGLVFVLAALTTSLWFLATPKLAWRRLAQTPAYLSTVAAAGMALAFTTIDHQSYPDAFLMQPFVAVTMALLAAAASVSVPQLNAPARTIAFGVALTLLIAYTIPPRIDWWGRGRFSLDQQREIAAAIESYRAEHGEVWVLGALHMLALERRGNFHEVGHFLMPGLLDSLEAPDGGWTFRPFSEGNLPDVIIVSRGGEGRNIRWIYKYFRRVPRDDFFEQRITVYERRPPYRDKQIRWDGDISAKPDAS